MPELPEVETIVRELREPLIGRTITSVRNDWPRQIGWPNWADFKLRSANRKFLAINRRGKFLVFSLDGDETLLIHLKMSGQLSVVDSTETADKHVHTVFVLDNEREFRFRDIRKFGRVYLTSDPAKFLGNLGLEPLSADFTSAWLYENLKKRNRILKTLLLDQTFIAGIGNIYADEALYRAYLDPRRRSSSLTHLESDALHESIQKVLLMGIQQGGSSIDGTYRKPDGTSGQMQTELQAYGRVGEQCNRCGHPIERLIIGSRSTHFCPNCQV